MKKASGGCFPLPALLSQEAPWEPHPHLPPPPTRPSSLICCPSVPRLALYCFSNLLIDLGNQITFVQPQKWPGVMEEASTGNQESCVRHKRRMLGWEGPEKSSLSSLSLHRGRNRRHRGYSPSLSVRHPLGYHFACLSLSLLICQKQKQLGFSLKENLEDGHCVGWPTQQMCNPGSVLILNTGVLSANLLSPWSFWDNETREKHKLESTTCTHHTGILNTTWY